jgi:hypothetical protein
MMQLHSLCLGKCPSEVEAPRRPSIAIRFSLVYAGQLTKQEKSSIEKSRRLDPRRPRRERRPAAALPSTMLRSTSPERVERCSAALPSTSRAGLDAQYRGVNDHRIVNTI